MLPWPSGPYLRKKSGSSRVDLEYELTIIRNELKAREESVYDIEQGRIRLDEELRALQFDHGALSDQYLRLLREFQDAIGSLEDSKRQQQALKSQVGRLKKYITRGATNANDLIDSDVSAEVTNIAARTQWIVKKYCVGSFASAPRHNQPELEEFDKHMATKLNDIPDQHYSQRDKEDFATYLVRSKIYFLLQRDIFNGHVFGLEDDLERNLAKFECLLIKSNRPDTDVSEWRALTVRHRKTLNMKNEELSKRTASYMAHLFSPWSTAYAEKQLRESEGVGAGGEEGDKTQLCPSQLETDLRDLCQAAYDLAVTLRQSTDKYYFVSISDNEKAAPHKEKYFGVEDMIGPRSEGANSNIWVTVFGALIKESQFGGQSVVAKGRVVRKAARPPSAQHKVSE